MLKQGTHCHQIVTALERVQGNTAAFQSGQLVLTGSAPLSRIDIADISGNSPLEVPGGHHPVTAVIAFPAEYKHPFRVTCERQTGKCPPGAIPGPGALQSAAA